MWLFENNPNSDNIMIVQKYNFKYRAKLNKQFTQIQKKIIELMWGLFQEHLWLTIKRNRKVGSGGKNKMEFLCITLFITKGQGTHICGLFQYQNIYYRHFKDVQNVAHIWQFNLSVKKKLHLAPMNNWEPIVVIRNTTYYF